MNLISCTKEQYERLFNAYTITYNYDGGTGNNPTSYISNDLPILLTAPTKNGYSFTGWTGSNGNIPEMNVTIPVGSTGNKSYTANWEYEPSVVIPSFANATEEEIVNVVNGYYDGTYSLSQIRESWNVGNVTNFSINGVDTQFAILDFNHDNLVNSINGKTNALLSLQTTRIYNGQPLYAGSANFPDGWERTTLKTWCNETFYSYFSSLMQSSIKQVVRPSSKGNQSTEIDNEIYDYVWLPAEIEVYGTVVNSVAGEGSQYEYFKTEANRLKKYMDTEQNYDWWLRSPYAFDQQSFCVVHYDGTIQYMRSSASFGVAPAISM